MIAPNQSVNEIPAIIFTDPTAAVPDSSHAAASSRMRFWMIAAHMAARNISAIFGQEWRALDENCRLRRKQEETRDRVNSEPGPRYLAQAINRVIADTRETTEQAQISH